MLFRCVRDPDNPHRVPPPGKKLARQSRKRCDLPPRDVAFLLPDLLSAGTRRPPASMERVAYMKHPAFKFTCVHPVRNQSPTSA